MKEKLIEILKDKELSLPEIYAAIPDAKQANIRTVLNLNIKKGTTFERVSRGRYKLKQ